MITNKYSIGDRVKFDSSVFGVQEGIIRGILKDFYGKEHEEILYLMENGGEAHECQITELLEPADGK